MLLLLPGSIMPQLNEVTGLVPLEFQYTPTPIAFTVPWFPKVLLVWSVETTGPRTASKSVYVSSPMVAITRILSCRFMFIDLYCVVRLNKSYRFNAQQKYSKSIILL